MIRTDVKRLFVDIKDSIADAAKVIQTQPEKIALVVDEENNLLGSVTDALIRTALLAGRAVSDPLSFCMYETPDFDFIDRPEDHYRNIMEEYKIYQLPLMDQDNKIKGIAYLEPEWKGDKHHPLVVIMAGGLGTRLSPLTDSIPKPMVEISGKPLLEHIIMRFKSCGFREFSLSVNYMADVIENHFGDGSKYGIKVDYIHEEKRMGTAGSLSLINVDSERPIFVTNGDVVTGLDYEAMMTFHTKRKGDATIGVNTYAQQIQYGVVSLEHHKVTKIEEKPIHKFLANSGNYIVQGKCLPYLPQNEFFDMPNLLNLLAQNNKHVMAYPLHEYWQDVGNLRDLEKARKSFSDLQSSLVKK